MARYVIVLVAGLLAAAPAPAATWAEAMFSELQKDFGSVPRGQTQLHSFRVKNNTPNNAAISSLRVSCGCVTATARTGFLRPGEETSVDAQMDTSRFVGPRTVTVFVQFSSPAFEEVRLTVTANSRSDFALTPDTLALGQLKRGAGGTGTVTLTFYGNRDARITKLRSETNYIRTTAVETRRLDHEVTYTITARMRPDTPVGKWFTDIWVETNLIGVTQVRVPLTVEVLSPLTVSPSAVAFGEVKAGMEAERRVIVRGASPFKVLSVKGADAEVTVVHSDAPREVHILKVKFKPSKAGRVEKALKIVTDLKGDNEAAVKVEANVIP